MQANGMIFWDWNGTLMDDVDFTHSCLNWMLETHGYPQRYDLAAYREIFGFPIEEYYIRAGFNLQSALMQSWPSALWNIITQVWMPVPPLHTLPRHWPSFRAGAGGRVCFPPPAGTT